MAPTVKPKTAPEDVDLSTYVDKAPTPLQAREPGWIKDNTGYDPTAAKTKDEAFAMGVKLCLNVHKFFQISPENKKATEESRAAKAAEAEERENAKLAKADEREAADAAKAEAKADREAKAKEKAEAKANKPAKAPAKTAEAKVPAKKVVAKKILPKKAVKAATGKALF